MHKQSSWDSHIGIMTSDASPGNSQRAENMKKMLTKEVIDQKSHTD